VVACSLTRGRAAAGENRGRGERNHPPLPPCYPDRAMSPAAEDSHLPEVIFLVEEAPEGGFTAHALGESIFTEANDVADLHVKVRDAVRCHFEEGKVPKIIRLHFIREEVLKA
jgi:hypothetical protein